MASTGFALLTSITVVWLEMCSMMEQSLLYIEEVNCRHRLFLLQSRFKEEARISFVRELYRALGDPNQPCEK